MVLVKHIDLPSKACFNAPLYLFPPTNINEMNIMTVLIATVVHLASWLASFGKWENCKFSYEERRKPKIIVPRKRDA